MTANTCADILLIEDNEGDIELIREAFNDAGFNHKLHVATDGDMALDYLFARNGYEKSEPPSIIILDLNLPKTDGRELLKSIKNNAMLKRIPAIIFTSSSAPQDITDSYDLGANCYIVKPVDALKFMNAVTQIEHFWINIACLSSST